MKHEGGSLLLLPWIGSTKIFAHSKKYMYSGLSSKTGFCINVHPIKSGRKLIFSTKGHIEEKPKQTRKSRQGMEKGAFREYHACEHKLVALLYEGAPITEKSLGEAPKNLFLCGSTVISMVVALLIMTGLSLSPLFASHFLIYAISLCGIIVILTLALNPIPEIHILLSTLLIIPPIAEYIFFLRNPRSSIIKEGVELGKQIERQLAEWEQNP